MSNSPFPSLLISESGFVPQGSFAEAQAEFLSPDMESVAHLDRLFAEKKIGVVAHFYMDPELQGVLSACRWEHIFISDSLKMADSAVEMVEAGCEHIIVLGVDFMSENARAMLDAANLKDVPVYRVASAEIGCSLASAADGPTYAAWLKKAGAHPRGLHVVYINTSLQTKAFAHSVVPTITCTSSNVVNTILTAFAQIEDLNIFYGPDTYMGENLEVLFEALVDMDDDAIRAVHPGHTRESIKSLLTRFHYFKQGNCVVHHMFGAEVARTVERDYPDAMITAHLEVPGEMFAIAMNAQRAGRGAVGSTSNILNFIVDQVESAIAAKAAKRLQFVLGTEAGMITSIVNRLRDVHQSHPGNQVETEIIFPVASDAITHAPESELAIVPGVSGGEGCSISGGCATCPYMKMNSLDALIEMSERIGVEADNLEAYHPRKYISLIDGQTAAELGGQPILHMRNFQREQAIPKALVEDILGRHGAVSDNALSS